MPKVEGDWRMLNPGIKIESGHECETHSNVNWPATRDELIWSSRTCVAQDCGEYVLLPMPPQKECLIPLKPPSLRVVTTRRELRHSRSPQVQFLSNSSCIEDHLLLAFVQLCKKASFE